MTNIDTGAQRTVVTNEDGVYRALLLPLGRYKVTAELQGFKKFEQQGITLSAGQTRRHQRRARRGQRLRDRHGHGRVAGRDSPARSISAGRSARTEVKNLPLVSRNPYNFAFLQANVTGYENNEFGVPRINANGTQMHTNYQLDGNTNTEKDRAGLRMLPVSEVLVPRGEGHHQRLRAGVRPDDRAWSTTRSRRRARTTSTARRASASGATPFSRPFFLAPTARKPDTEVNDVTATLGGPIPRDRWHYFGAYEYVDRSLVTGGQVITVSPSTAQALGLTLPADGVIPAHQKVNFLFGKTDYQINPANRLSVRYFLFKNFSPANIGGGLTTTDRATDFTDRMDSASAQLVSTIGADMLNELRVQYARRHQFRTLRAAVDGPAITVTGVANFGGPRSGETTPSASTSTRASRR